MITRMIQPEQLAEVIRLYLQEAKEQDQEKLLKYIDKIIYERSFND